MRKKRYGFELSVMREVKKHYVDPRYHCGLPMKRSADDMIRSFAKHLFKANGKCRRCGKARKGSGS